VRIWRIRIWGNISLLTLTVSNTKAILDHGRRINPGWTLMPGSLVPGHTRHLSGIVPGTYCPEGRKPCTRQYICYRSSPSVA